MQDAGTPPDPPDPYATANAQGKANVNSAIATTALGNANEVSPYGDVNYAVTGYTNVNGRQVPNYTRTTTLSPQQQTLYNQQTALGAQENNVAGTALNNVSSILGQPINLGGLPPATNSVNSGRLATSFDPGGSIVNSYDPGGSITRSYDPGGAVQMQLGGRDFSADRDAATNAILARLQPQQDRDQANMNAMLANQGVSQGSDAWNAAQASRIAGVNDARLAAVQAGDAEQQAGFAQLQARGQFANAAQAQQYGENQGLAQFQNAAQAQQNAQNAAAAQFRNAAQGQQFGENQARAEFGNTAMTQQLSNDISAGQFGNTARQQAYQEQVGQRELPLNEITALMSGGQVTAPQFTQYRAGTVDAAPVASSVYGSANLAQQGYTTQAQMAGQTNSGLFGLGGSILGLGGNYLGNSIFQNYKPLGGTLSDRRMKRDIARIGSFGRFPLYQFRYVGRDGMEIGVMADEVLAIEPAAVMRGADGYLLVDYDRLAV